MTSLKLVDQLINMEFASKVFAYDNNNNNNNNRNRNYKHGISMLVCPSMEFERTSQIHGISMPVCPSIEFERTSHDLACPFNFHGWTNQHGYSMFIIVIIIIIITSIMLKS